MLPVSFKNSKGETLRGFIHKPRTYNKAALFLHGFPGSSEGTAKSICRRLVKHGILCLRFDFSGTNRSDGRFEDKTISKEVSEIRNAVDFLEREYKISSLTLIGTSTGAIEAALYAHTDRRVKALVLMGMIYDAKTGIGYDFNKARQEMFRRKGYITYIRPGRWYHRKRLKRAYYDDFLRQDIPAAIRAFRGKTLFIHGSRDIFIPEADARKLFGQANRPKRFVLIKGAGHSYWGRYDMVSGLIAAFACSLK